MSDAEIILAVQTRTPDFERAIRTFILRNKSRVNTAVRNHQISWEAARDAFNDAIYCILYQMQAGKLALDTNLEAYSYRVYQNKIRDKLRKQQRERPVEAEALQHLSDQQQAFRQEMERPEDIAVLKKSLKNLKTQHPSCWEMIRLRYYMNCRYKEIKERLTMSNENAARQKMKRCLDHLRKQFPTTQGG